MTYRYLALVVAFAALIGGLLLFQRPETTTASSNGGAPTLDTDIPGLANYREALVNYATVTRPDNLSRDIYISPGAAEQVANNSTARLPNGTVIVIEAHTVRAVAGDTVRQGFGDNIHAAVKRDDWTAADFQTGERAGSWNYFSFDPETGAVTDESIFECFDCHSNNSQIDFIFSRELLSDYGETATVQDTFCNFPNRIPCRF